MKKFLILCVLFTGITFAKPNIVVLATGGTIAGAASSAVSASYKPSTLLVDKILDSVPSLKDIANIQGEQLVSISSQDITNDVYLKLAKKVNSLLAQRSVDGVVITHGTDTLEESAFFLNLVVKSKKPVVVVGAMRAATSLSSDGALNLYNAVAVAGSKEAIGKGVLVVMNDEIHSARDVTKTNTTALQTFKSPNSGKIGAVNYGAVRFYLSPLRKHTVNSEFDINKIKSFSRVDILYAHPNDDPAFVETALKQGAKGIVLDGMGNGNAFNTVLEALGKVAKEGVSIARSSRTGSGSTSIGAEIDDKAYGFVTADNLNAQKARIVLMLSIASGKSLSDIQRIFDTY